MKMDNTGVERIKELIPLSNLTEREKVVIEKRLEGYTQEKIAQMYNTHRDKIRRLEISAVKKLKFTDKIDKLKS